MRKKLIEIFYSPVLVTTEQKLLAIQTLMAARLTKKAGKLNHDIHQVLATSELICEFMKEFDDE